MDLVSLLTAARVTVVAGKGGVGKTTVTAVLATAAAASGLRVLAVELDGKPVLADLLGDVPHLALSAKMALQDYLLGHGFGRIAKRLSSSGVIDVVSTAAPGIDDIVVLGKIKQLERSGEWDVIVVDGPAAGHAVTMLTSASGLRDAVSGGPVRTQADEVLEMLHDPARSQVALVTLPETTPVNETVETAFTLEDRVMVRLAPVIVNGVDIGPRHADGASGAETSTDGSAASLRPALVSPAPQAPQSKQRHYHMGRLRLLSPLVANVGDVSLTGAERAALRSAAEFRDERIAVQAAAIAQLAESLPIAQFHLPFVPAARLDRAAIERLAGSVAAPVAGSAGAGR